MVPEYRETIENNGSNTEDTSELREVYAEKAETQVPELSAEEMRALALEYARYLREKDLKPGEATFIEPEELLNRNKEAESAEESEAEETVSEKEPQAEETVPAEEPEVEEAAPAEETQPEEPTPEEEPEAEEAASTEEIQAEEPASEEKLQAEETASEEETQAEEPVFAEEPQAEESAPAEESPDKKVNKKTLKAAKYFTDAEPDAEELRKVSEMLSKSAGKGIGVKTIDKYDNFQNHFVDAAYETGREFVKAGHRITSTYRQSRKIIGFALLLVGVFAAVVLAIFDAFTVYEYAYNGKILGYVKNQEDVIEVLDIAGTKMSENNSGSSEVTFAVNQNVTFNLVDSRGKSIDDPDIAINKLVYMTDIETEAYGVYDGKELVAVVKSDTEAENLLNQAMRVLSQPDEGMELVSAEYKNALDIKPVNVLLTSVQSYERALENMTKGGSFEIYHIVEAEESLGSIVRTFGVDPVNIYDESNTNIIQAIEQGDKICIRKTITPVSVKMVETGKMKEIIEYETIKKMSDDYYEGDTHIEQEGVNGIQIFEGTLTKVGGEVTKRKEVDIQVRRKKQDKIIIVGTAERPRTAPTGTYVMPIHNYVLTSNFGYRWGRLHAGIDMGAPTGTPIYATDGGTVVKSEYYSGYGNVVYIQHESGRQTRYAHCSQLLVNYGDKVYQGQLIALVGNTGHSFGSHLHFEILFNETPVNPRPYLGI